MTAWPSESSPPPPRHSPLGVASLVLGILGLTALPLIGSILALVFGYKARQEAWDHPDEFSDDFGRIGRILGWIGVLVSVLVIAAGVAFVVLFLPVDFP